MEKQARGFGRFHTVVQDEWCRCPPGAAFGGHLRCTCAERRAAAERERELELRRRDPSYRSPRHRPFMDYEPMWFFMHSPDPAWWRSASVTDARGIFDVRADGHGKICLEPYFLL